MNKKICNIRKFDMQKKISLDRSILICGNSRQGKSTLASDIYEHIDKHKNNIQNNNSNIQNNNGNIQNNPSNNNNTNNEPTRVVCVSATEDVDKIYPKIPTIFIHRQYSDDLMERFIHVTKMTQYFKRKFNNALILDECLPKNINNKYSIDDNLRCLFMNGRHYRTSITLILEQVPSLPNYIRANLDYIFLFAEKNKIMRKKFYVEYAGMFSNLAQFEKIFDEYTQEKYTCLVIDNNSRSSELEDQVFWYKVDLSPRIAVNKITNWWLSILAKRRLTRLKNCKELELYPNIGIKYQEAMNNFYALSKDNHHSLQRNQ